MKYAVLVTVFAVAACGAGANETAQTEEQAAEPTQEVSGEAEALTMLASMAEKYADASAAVADGYMRDPSGACVTADMVGLPAETGAMGVHYIHPEYIGLTPESVPVGGTDDVIDWSRPEVLVYEPQADGSEKLVAIEYLVFSDPWAAAGNAEPPSFHGTPFVTMINDPSTEPDEAHGFAGHHELHIWVPRENPSGRYAEFNPAVSCEHAPHASM